MKYVKILSLLAVAAAAMMAFAGTASADYLSTDKAGGATAEPTIHSESEGHVTLKNPIANISCASTTEGKPNTHGAGEAVSGPISTLTFTGCTNSWHVTVSNPGSLSVSATGGGNGSLTSSGAKVDTTRFGVTCVYETKNTPIGSVTGGNPATLHVSASIPINSEESSGLCGSSNSAWEGSYKTTSALYVNAS